jgi:hypothetical protein
MDKNNAYNRSFSEVKELHTAYTSNYDNTQEEKQGLILKVWGNLRSWVARGMSTPLESSPVYNTYVGSQRLSPSHDIQHRRFTEPRTRQDLIAQIRKMMADNPLMSGAWKKYAEGALGTGFVVLVKRTAKTGFVAQREASAQRTIDRITRKCKLRRKAAGWARWLVAEGDLFVQLKLQPTYDFSGQQSGFEIIDTRKMPAATMERLTDDKEEFIDPREAYLQRDINTNAVIATFAEWQIIHARFDYEDGSRYGNSLFFSVRTLAAKALASSIALSDRRRATMPTIAHIIGKPDQRATQTQLDIYKKDVSKENRIKRGELSEYSEIFVNGGDVKAILTDTNLEKVDDIILLYDLALAPTGVSRQLIGSGVTVNRDILDEQRSELYAVQRQLADLFAEEVFRPIFDFGLLLAGIDPETIHYDILFKQRYTESALERRIDRALKSKAAGTLATKDVMNVQADYFDITDPDEAVERIEEESSIKVDSGGGIIPGRNNRPGQPGQESGFNGNNSGQETDENGNPINPDEQNQNPSGGNGTVQNQNGDRANGGFIKKKPA